MNNSRQGLQVQKKCLNTELKPVMWTAEGQSGLETKISATRASALHHQNVCRN